MASSRSSQSVVEKLLTGKKRKHSELGYQEQDFIDVEEAFLTIGTEEVFVLFFLLTLFCPTRVVLGRLGFLGFLNKKTISGISPRSLTYHHSSIIIYCPIQVP